MKIFHRSRAPRIKRPFTNAEQQNRDKFCKDLMAELKAAKTPTKVVQAANKNIQEHYSAERGFSQSENRVR